jgi:ArsR family transcriptional regulator, arsenate/arsenite/antimonite-responsive transcriptional repressor
MKTITKPTKTAKVAESDAVRALAALAQTQRLRAFRALVVAGTQGLTPSAIAAMLDIAPSALSFHLKELSHSSLVTVEQQGRNLIYRANFAQITSLLGYLTQHCCAGQSCELPTSALTSC